MNNSTSRDSAPLSHRLRSGSIETIKTVGCALAIALVLRVLLFQPYTIPSGSMEPGVQAGDYIIVSKFAYGWSRYSIPLAPPLFTGRVLRREPKRGDVVVFALPRDPKQTYIKRIIGLPGDRIQLRNGVVFINGSAITQAPEGQASDPSIGGIAVAKLREHMPSGKAYLIFDQGPDHEADDTGVYVTPHGHYFVMGDNRDNSLDSRYPRALGVGFVPAENLVGRAEFILASWREGVSVFKPWTWVTEFDLGRVLRRLA